MSYQTPAMVAGDDYQVLEDEVHMYIMYTFSVIYAIHTIMYVYVKSRKHYVTIIPWHHMTHLYYI